MSEINVLREVGLSTTMVGVKSAQGPDGQEAFKLKPSKRDISASVERTRELLAVLTRQQTGFVVAVTVQQDPRNRGTIVSFDKTDSERAFGFHVDRRLNEAVLQYVTLDSFGNPYETAVYFERLHPLSEMETKLWHTYIVEVNQNLATIYVDCEQGEVRNMESAFYRDIDINQDWHLRVGKGVKGRQTISDFRVRSFSLFLNL